MTTSTPKPRAPRKVTRKTPEIVIPVPGDKSETPIFDRCFTEAVPDVAKAVAMIFAKNKG